MEEQIWKDVQGYEGLYQVSNFGYVRNRYGEILRDAPSPKGRSYRNIQLFKGGKGKRFYIHRLVAQAFIPNPENKEVVNHKNFDKMDCRVENLEWCSRKENCQHAWNNGVMTPPPNPNKGKFGKNHHNSRQILMFSKTGELIRSFDSAACASRELNVHTSNICKCANGKIPHSNGYIWKWAEGDRIPQSWLNE